MADNSDDDVTCVAVSDAGWNQFSLFSWARSTARYNCSQEPEKLPGRNRNACAYCEYGSGKRTAKHKCKGCDVSFHLITGNGIVWPCFARAHNEQYHQHLQACGDKRAVDPEVVALKEANAKPNKKAAGKKTTNISKQGGSSSTSFTYDPTNKGRDESGE